MEEKIQQSATPSGNFMSYQKKNITQRIKLCLLIMSIYIILNFLHIGCPIKGFTGISCPGCGMTRAGIAAMQFHFEQAFYYHPLFFLAPIMLGLFIFDSLISSKYKKVAWIIIISLFIITYFYRLLFTNNNVVAIDLSSSLIARLLHYIKEMVITQ